MQMMMSNLLASRFENAESRAQQEEDAMLQRALEESRREAEGSMGPNTDNMTYEQLLQLEQDNGGSVSRGLTAA